MYYTAKLNKKSNLIVPVLISLFNLFIFIVIADLMDLFQPYYFGFSVYLTFSLLLFSHFLPDTLLIHFLHSLPSSCIFSLFVVLKTIECISIILVTVLTLFLVKFFISKYFSMILKDSLLKKIIPEHHYHTQKIVIP